MKKTRLMLIYPLSSGLDLSAVPGTQAPTALRIAKNVVCSTKPSLRKRPGQRRIPYIGEDDGTQAAIHFFGTVGGGQIQEVVRVRKGKVEVIRDLSGSEPQVVDLGLTVSDTDTVTFSRFGNALLLHFENTEPYYYTAGGTLGALPIPASHAATPPRFSRAHHFRLWYSGRGANPHVVYASEPNNIAGYTLLYGAFSMSIDFGDGDPVGITGLSPTFRKDLYAYKWLRMYRIFLGDYGYGWEQVSDEVGAVHQNAIAASQNDLYSIDVGGWHSLQTTAAYGGTEDVSLSRKIHEWFQENVNWSQAKNMVLVYDKATACVLLSYAKAGSSVNNAVLGMNIFTHEFFEWTDIEYPSMCKYFEFGRERTMVADVNRGLCLLDSNYNTLEGDPINVEAKVGPVFPMGNPKIEVNFTQAWLLCRPTLKTDSITVLYSIDGKDEISVSLDPVGTGYGALIANTASGGLIGQDEIGRMDQDMAVIPFPFAGDGGSVSFRILHEPAENDPDQEFDVYGIVAEFEYAEDLEETKTS